jgi:hypothetical protein
MEFLSGKQHSKIKPVGLLPISSNASCARGQNNGARR